jgi:hypothetical protein
MIQIDDFDSPIQVAEKVINGTKKVPASTLDKVFGEEDMVSKDMFELEEIKEIAGYLMVYYEAHRTESEEV